MVAEEEGEGSELLEKAPGFRRYSSFYQCFQQTVGEILDRSLSPSPPLTEHTSPHSSTALLHITQKQLLSLYVTPCSNI